MTQAASAKKDSVSYLDVIKFEAGTLAKDGREVTLSMNIVLDSARIRSQHTLSLTPWIVSADGAGFRHGGRGRPYQASGI